MDVYLSMDVYYSLNKCRYGRLFQYARLFETLEYINTLKISNGKSPKTFSNSRQKKIFIHVIVIPSDKYVYICYILAHGVTLAMTKHLLHSKRLHLGQFL